MSDVRATLLTPQALDAWLAGHDPEASVGTRFAIRTCPLASYLSAKTGWTWRIWGGECEPAEGPEADQVTILPEWAERFTIAVDSYGEPTLTASQARACLEQALEHTYYR